VTAAAAGELGAEAGAGVLQLPDLLQHNPELQAVAHLLLLLLPCQPCDDFASVAQV
jgi:hypothetical protein